jgi:hypothetical protein
MTFFLGSMSSYINYEIMASYAPDKFDKRGFNALVLDDKLCLHHDTIDVLERSGLRNRDVEEFLRLVYTFPATIMRSFGWREKHYARAWRELKRTLDGRVDPEYLFPSRQHKE